MSTSTPKGTAKRSFYFTFMAFADMFLFTFFAFMITKSLLGTLGNGRGASDSIKMMLIITIFLICLLFASVSLYILKISPTIYYYEDGFTVGKNGEKILYQSLQYHIIPGTTPNKMLGILYKSAGKMIRLNAHLYASRSLDMLQDDVVTANLPQDMQKIENGQTIEFRALNPNRAGGLKTIKSLDKKIENGIKVKINKVSIIFDDEVYKWAEYTVVSDYAGLIVILDATTDRKVLTFANHYMIEQPNVVTNIINILGGR